MNREQRIGQLFVLAAVALESFYPVAAHGASGILPPLWFIGVCQLLSSLMHGGIITLQGWRRIPLTAAFLRRMAGVALFIIVIPNSLLLLGTRMSTGINTGLLLSAEIPITAIVSWLFFREKIGATALVGIMLTLAGMLAIFGSTPGTGMGELLIVIGILTIPFGNLLAKRLLATCRGTEILFFRSVIAGAVLLAASALSEEWPAFPLSREALQWVLLYTVFTLVIGKILWYAGLRRLRIIDAVALIAAGPAFSLLAAAALLGEQPSPLQFLGFLLIVIGLVLVTNIHRLRRIPVE